MKMPNTKFLPTAGRQISNQNQSLNEMPKSLDPELNSGPGSA
jgi:hypothetical protein